MFRGRSLLTFICNWNAGREATPKVYYMIDIFSYQNAKKYILFNHIHLLYNVKKNDVFFVSLFKT